MVYFFFSPWNHALFSWGTFHTTAFEYSIQQNVRICFPNKLEQKELNGLKCVYFSEQTTIFFFVLSLLSTHQFTPAIRPCLQTLAIGLVAFGENYRRHQSGIGQHYLDLSCCEMVSPSIHTVIQSSN